MDINNPYILRKYIMQSTGVPDVVLLEHEFVYASNILNNIPYSFDLFRHLGKSGWFKDLIQIRKLSKDNCGKDSGEEDWFASRHRDDLWKGGWIWHTLNNHLYFKKRVILVRKYMKRAHHGGISEPAKSCLFVWACLLPDKYFSECMNMCESLHVFCRMGCKEWAEAMKDLTSLCKKAQRGLIDGWYLLVNLDTFVGYDLGGGKKTNDFGEMDDWLGKLEGGVDNWAYYKPAYTTALDVAWPDTVTSERVTFHDYIANPDNWVTKGSDNVKSELTFELQGGEQKTFKAKRTKAVTAATLSVETIVDDVIAPKSFIMIKASRKIEPGRKHRFITAVPRPLQLAQGYGSSAMEQFWKNSDVWMRTLLFSNPASRQLFWDRMYRALDSKANVFLPYDAPSFDHKVTAFEIFSACDRLIAACDDYERRKMLSWAKELMLTSHVEFDKGDGVMSDFVYGHGIPSGWRWTALMNTLVNVTRSEVILKGLFDLFKFPCRYNSNGQGDDVLLVANITTVCLLYYVVMKHCGIGANAMKNFLSVNSFEYLRATAWMEDDKLVLGKYFARKITGLLYAMPGKNVHPPKLTRIKELVSDINTMYTRGLDSGAACALLDGLVNLGDNGKESLMIRDWILTPASYGGVGLIFDEWRLKFDTFQCVGAQAFIDSDSTKKDVVSIVGAGAMSPIGKWLPFVGKQGLSSIAMQLSTSDPPVSRWLRDNEAFKLKKIDCVHMETNNYNEPFALSSTKVLQPHGDLFYPTVVINFALSKMVNGNFSDTLVMRWRPMVPDDMYNFVYERRHTWSKTALYAWIKGRFKSRSPIIIGLGSGLRSTVVNTLWKRQLKKLYFMNDVPSSVLHETSLRVEFATAALYKRGLNSFCNVGD